MRPLLVDFYQSWSKQCRCSHIVRALERTGGIRNHSYSQTVHDVLRTWKEGRYRDARSIDLDVLGLLHYRQVLLVDVDYADGVRVGAIVCECELKILVLELNILCIDGQGTEDRQVDDVCVRAGTWYDNHLVENAERPGSGRSCKERSLTRDQVQ